MGAEQRGKWEAAMFRRAGARVSGQLASLPPGNFCKLDMAPGVLILITTVRPRWEGSGKNVMISVNCYVWGGWTVVCVRYGGPR